jgi:hypothetical protein
VRKEDAVRLKLEKKVEERWNDGGAVTINTL